VKKNNDVPRVALATLGCKVNQYESAALEAAFAEKGFVVVPFTDEADCYLVNTCTVTGRTDYQSRQLVRRAVRRNAGALIVVTGCYAQTRAEDLAGIPGVAIIAGNREKEAIPGMVADLWERKKREELPSAAPHRCVGEGGGADLFSFPEVRHFPGHTRAFLKIQDGCNAFCSYCIVPYARGRSRSLPPGDVLRRIAGLGGQGYREVVLTGIHLGCYGQDADPPAGLAALLRQVEARGLVDRLRISSIEPLEVTDELLALLAGAARICPHLHIPLQSGDDTILSLMNRHYDRLFFRGLVERIAAARPETAVGLDVMVGFPGEDERAFQQTVELIAGLPVAYLHVFPYSKRPGTAASAMAGHVRDEDKKKRAEQLRDLGQEKRLAFMERFVGKRLQVLLESRVDKKSGFHKGFSENYLPVTVVDGTPGLINQVIPVLVDEIGNGGLIGRIIHE